MVPLTAGAKIASKGDEEKQTVIFGYSDGPVGGHKIIGRLMLIQTVRNPAANVKHSFSEFAANLLQTFR